MTDEEKQDAAPEGTTEPELEKGTTDTSAPEGTTDTSASDDSTSEETDEQKALREAHFQKLSTEKERQLTESMERLDALDDTGYLRGVAQGEIDPRKQPPATGQDTGQDELVGDMTKGELGQLIAGAVAGPVSAAQQQAEFGSKYNANYTGAVSELKRFNKENNISAEDSDEMLRDVRTNFGITLMHERDENGQAGRQTPVQLMRAYVREYQIRGMGKVTQSKAEEARIAAAAKIAAAKQVSQPAGGSPGEARDITEDQKLLDGMKSVGRSLASEEFWDKK